MLFFNGERTYMDYLLGTGQLRQSQVDGSYDGSPDRLAASRGAIAVQGFATSEPWKWQHEVPAWDKPLHYQLVSDSGYPNYRNLLAIRSGDKQRLTPCLQRLVPILQQSTVDFMARPDPVIRTILSVIDKTKQAYTDSAARSEQAVTVMRDAGLVTDGRTRVSATSTRAGSTGCWRSTSRSSPASTSSSSPGSPPTTSRRTSSSTRRSRCRAGEGRLRRPHLRPPRGPVRPDLRTARRRAAGLADVPPAGRGDRAVDLGCGTGVQTAMLADRYDEVLAVDLSGPMVEFARGAGPGRRPVRTARPAGGRDRDTDGRFDLVFSAYTLHHVSEVDTALHRIRSLVRPGGLVLLVDIVDHRPQVPRSWFRAEAWRTFGADLRHRRRSVGEAVELLRLQLDPDWLDHQTTDRLRPREEWDAHCRAVFPGAAITTLHRARALAWGA